MHQGQHVAAETTGIGHDHAQHRLRGDGRVRGGSAADEHFLPRGHRQRMRGRDRAETRAAHTAVYPPSMTIDVPAM